MERLKPWSNTPLNLEEFYEAIEEGRKRKYFKMKFAPYWAEKESMIIKDRHVKNIG
jgi:hypothetical protein